MNRADLEALAGKARAAREAFLADERGATDEYVHAAVTSTIARDKFTTAALDVLPVLLRRLDLAEQALAAVLEGDKEPRVANFWKDRGNAPGHCHGNPPRWDESDEVCQWCAAWIDARAALSVLRRPLDQPDDTT